MAEEQVTNWLDPKDVEKWLAVERACGCAKFDMLNCPSCCDDYHWALEQFVRALAAKSENRQWHMCGCEIAAVARLLREAMGE